MITGESAGEGAASAARAGGGDQMRCPRCAEPFGESGGLNFCTACGYDLRTPTAAGAATPLPPPIVRLVACPHCGASNAASRQVCGRCRSALDEAAPPSAPEPALAPAPAETEPSRLLLVVTLIAGFVIVSVLLTLLGARGIGIVPLPQNSAAPSEFARLEVASVTASSTLTAAGEVSYEPANLIDGDPTSAWNEGARGAAGAWVEVTLAEEARVTRLLVWNGYQKDGQFLQNGRVQTLLIDAGERRFTVELLDLRGSQAVDLPEPVPTTRIRLTVDAVYAGDRYPDIALSEIEVYGVRSRV